MSLSAHETGRPSVWAWSPSRGPSRIVKYAGGDRESIRRLHRELAVIEVLQDLPCVAKLFDKYEEHGEIRGFCLEHLHHAPSVDWLELPPHAIARPLAQLHAVSLGKPYPPFGLDLPVLFEGHGFWLSGERVVRGALEDLKRTRFAGAAREVRTTISRLTTNRARLTAPFKSDEFALIHGDTAKENLRLPVVGEPARLIDFGEAVVGPVQHDLARAAVSLDFSADRQDELVADYLTILAELAPFHVNHARFREGFDALLTMAAFDIGMTGPTLAVVADPIGSDHEWYKLVVSRSSRRIARLLEQT